MKRITLIIVAILCFLPIIARSGDNRFKIRGIKGFCWSPEQYLAEIPTLKSYDMNFLMVCYGSFFDNYKLELGKNNWRTPLTEQQKCEWKNIIKLCKENNISFCFGINPMLYCTEPLNTDVEADFEHLLDLYLWFANQGVEWFYLALDDLHLHKGIGVDGVGQSKFTNRLYRALLQNNPNSKMIFCPTWYWGSNIKTDSKRAYLEDIAKFLDKQIYTFWTGNDIVCPTITTADADLYRSVVGHSLILWDNYPVNDFFNTLNVGPLRGRDPKLCSSVEGMISNPMRDNQLNRLPLYTIAQYMNNPAHYNPQKSIKRAICAIGKNRAEKKVLRSLVLLYPGGIVRGYTSTKYSVIRLKFDKLLKEDRTKAEQLAMEVEKLVADFQTAFPCSYQDTKAVLSNDLKWFKEKLEKR